MDEGAADAAAAWFVRLEGHEVAADDWLQFEQWLQAAPTHARAYEQLERLSAELAAMSGELAAALDAPRAAPRRVPAQRRGDPHRMGVPRRAWLAGGGAAIAASLAAVMVLQSQQIAQAPTVYQAAAGQTRTVRLVDGTQVRLNAASTLSVSFAADARRVKLADAEAAFDVTHETKRPFLISVGDSHLRVVGTEFNLRHRGGTTELTVRRGVVEVRAASGSSQPYRIAAGQRYVRQDGAETAAITPVDPDDAFAWTRGQLVYSDRPMSEVAADLSRRFGAPVSVADARTGQIRFTGVLVTDNETSVLRRLESFAPVRAVRTADGVVLKGR